MSRHERGVRRNGSPGRRELIRACVVSVGGVIGS